MTEIVNKEPLKEIKAKNCESGCFYRDLKDRIWYSPYKLSFTSGGLLVYLLPVGHDDSPCINPGMLLKEKIKKATFE